jgi:hypothetical protein
MTLGEALEMVSTGAMEGSSLYQQAPKQIKELLDEVSREKFEASFTTLNSKRQAEVCRQVATPLQLTLEEALKLVVESKMDGETFYGQAPKELRQVLDEVSRELFQMDFSKVSKERQREVAEQLLAPPPLSLEAALRLVSEGKMEGVTLYDQSPDELRELLNRASHELLQSDFSDLTKERQAEVCGTFLDTMSTDTSS